jgi:hypothetical protein
MYTVLEGGPAIELAPIVEGRFGMVGGTGGSSNAVAAESAS